MKTKNIFLTVALALSTTFAFAQSSLAGTAHDFTGWVSNTNGEYCISCHTPHDSKVIADAPLWNHAESVATSYTVYDSPTLTASLGNTPKASSLLCLSCHDGTMAIDSYGTTTGTTRIASTAVVGDGTATGAAVIDISTEHPISFTYATSFAAETATGLNALLATSPYLIGGEVECASCHDVHASSGVAKLLRTTNAGSALCLQCHNK